jgi:[ribosomal protein S18]-alanine N-acetyltransferase
MWMNLDIHIRLATSKDIPDILKIEKKCFREPWTKPIFKMMLKHTSLDDKGQVPHNFYVSELLDDIIGYIIWENEYIYRNDDDNMSFIGHIMNLAITSKQRRHGFGRMLLEFAFKKMRDGGINNCYLEVRESNLPAIGLYESVGMSYNKRLKNYYFNEDGLTYFKKLQ